MTYKNIDNLYLVSCQNNLDCLLTFTFTASVPVSVFFHTCCTMLLQIKFYRWLCVEIISIDVRKSYQFAVRLLWFPVTRGHRIHRLENENRCFFICAKYIEYETKIPCYSKEFFFFLFIANFF